MDTDRAVSIILKEIPYATFDPTKTELQPYSDEFKVESTKNWAVDKIINVIFDHPQYDPIETLEQYAFEMKCYMNYVARTEGAKMCQTLIDVTNDILGSLYEEDFRDRFIIE